MRHDDLRSVEDHLAVVLAAARQRREERPVADDVALDAASGRTLVAPVVAATAVPPFDNSAMDGFAVRWADVEHAAPQHPSRLRVVADLPAGTADDPALPAGSAARIMTGAPIPTDADTVVPFEDTAGGLDDSLDEAVVLRAPRARGAHIRRAGEDVAAGAKVLPAGAVLGARAIAAAAAAGVARVEVAPRPRIAVISTGSELVAAGEPLPRGSIPESNGLLLAGLAREVGADVVLRRVVRDDGDGATAAVRDAAVLDADVVVLTGGVGSGAYEPVRRSLGAEMEFVRVAMQPGKPQAFGVGAHGMLLFGLPGNPVAAAVSFEAFVRPALLALQARGIERPNVVLPVAEGWRVPAGRKQYLPVLVDRRDPASPTVRPATSGGSHLAVGLAAADAYAVVPADVDHVAAGDLVEVVMLT